MAITSFAPVSRTLSSMLPNHFAFRLSAADAGKQAAAAWFCQQQQSLVDYRHTRRLAYINDVLSDAKRPMFMPLTLLVHAFNSGFSDGLAHRLTHLS